MTSLTSPDNIVYWTTSDPASLVSESATQAASIQAALTSRGGVVANPAALDALSTASIGGRVYMTNPGSGIEGVVWEAYAGTGAGLDWHIVGTVRASSVAALDAFIAVIAATADLRFVIGGLIHITGAKTFYKFTTVNGAYIPLGGLVPMIPSSVGGATASPDGAINFSASAGPAINGCFTSDFDNYRIVANITLKSAATDINLRTRVGGVLQSGPDYYGVRGVDAGTTRTVTTQSGTTVVAIDGGAATGASAGETIIMDIFSPMDVAPTKGTWQSSSHPTPTSAQGSIIHAPATAVACDGFTFSPSSGTISGTIRVYGYNDN